MSKRFKDYCMKRSKKLVIAILFTIVITWIVIYGRSNMLYKDVGTVTEKTQDGDDYFTTVVSDNSKRIFFGKKYLICLKSRIR